MGRLRLIGDKAIRRIGESNKSREIFLNLSVFIHYLSYVLAYVREFLYLCTRFRIAARPYSNQSLLKPLKLLELLELFLNI